MCLAFRKQQMKETKSHINPSDLEDAIGDSHESFSTETPLRDDAFAKTDDQKIEIIQAHIKGIMETLGLDLEDVTNETMKSVMMIIIANLLSSCEKRDSSLHLFIRHLC